MAKEELARQGRGATLSVYPKDKDVELARQDVDLTEGNLNDIDYPYDNLNSEVAWKFKEVGTACRYRGTHHLLAATSKDDSYARMWPHSYAKKAS